MVLLANKARFQRGNRICSSNMSATTMYAIQKVEKGKASPKTTAIAIKKTASPDKGNNGESSVWQRKAGNHGPLRVGASTIPPARKRNRRKRSKGKQSGGNEGIIGRNGTGSGSPSGSTSSAGLADSVLEDDISSKSCSFSPHDHNTIPSRTVSPEASATPSKNSKKKEATPSSYDPSTNPYSLENYKRDPELQITLESNANKGVVIAKTHLEQELGPGAATQVPLTPLFPTPPKLPHLQPQGMDLQAVQLPPSFAPHSTAARGALNGRAPMGGGGTVRQSYQRLNQLQPHHTATHPPRRQQQYAHSNGNSHGHISQNKHYGHSKRSMHHVPLRSMSLQEHLSLQDSSHCPHGDLTPEQLINIKIRKRNVCYVVGLPITVATEQRLRAEEWFGQFGNIATIAINRNQKSTLANSIPAHITYDNNISALNAINFCNKFVFDDGRKLKATFGTQHYCRWFISANKKCTNVYCGFRHSWCRADDIITQKDIADFKAIPAGAYTSRNVENQPMNMRNGSHETFKHSSHTLQSPRGNGRDAVNQVTRGPRSMMYSTGIPTAPSLTAGGVQSRTVPLFAQKAQAQAQPTPVYQTTISTSTVSEDTDYIRAMHPKSNIEAAITSTEPPLTGIGAYSVDTGATAAAATAPGTVPGQKAPPTLTAISADPYTFYLSNSALTPTGPSPLSPAVAAPATASTLPGGLGAISPMATSYAQLNQIGNDRRFKAIVSTNETQKVEIQRLTQQVKQLSEMEMKNKQNIERWYNESEKHKAAAAAQTQRADKLAVDMKKLEAKHDELQTKYLNLAERYAKLEKKQDAANKEFVFEQWGSKEVLQWMMQLDTGKFRKYEESLSAKLEEENIDGACLRSLDKGDLHRLGVTDFKDKAELLAHIQAKVRMKRVD